MRQPPRQKIFQKLEMIENKRELSFVEVNNLNGIAASTRVLIPKKTRGIDD